MAKPYKPRGDPWNKAGLAGRLIFWGQVSIGLLVCGIFFSISTSRLRQPSPEVFWESLQKVSSDLKCKHMPYLPFPSPFFQQMRIKMLSEGH